MSGRTSPQRPRPTATRSPSERDDWPRQEESAVIKRSIATDDPHALEFVEARIGGAHPLRPAAIRAHARLLADILMNGIATI